MKKFLAFILAATVIISGCFGTVVFVSAEDEVPLESITLNCKSIEIPEGGTFQLTPIYNPTDATEKGVTWTSSRASIAAVSSSGLVTAKKIGSTVITVKSKYNPPTDVPSGTGGGGSSLPIIPLGGIIATCRVTVVCAHKTTTTVQENMVLPTYAVKGSYDRVCYCDSCGAEVSRTPTDIPATGRRQEYGNISLEGDIGVNVYLDLSGFELKNPKVVAISYNVAGNKIARDYTDLTPIGEGTYANYYEFSVYMAAHQMTDEIIFALYDGNSIVTDFGTDGMYYTSIKEMQEQYIEYYTDGAGKNDEKAAQTVQLCKTYLAYGSRAQLYFKNNVDDLADENYSIAQQVEAVKASDINAERVVSEEKATGFKILSSTFMVTSKSAIRFYYQLDGTFIGNYTVSATIDGETAKLRRGINSVNEAYIEIYDISAKNLDGETILTVVNNNDSTFMTASYNAMCFAKNMIKGSDDQKLVNMCKAMYLFSNAANAYFEDTQGDIETAEILD